MFAFVQLSLFEISTLAFADERTEQVLNENPDLDTAPRGHKTVPAYEAELGTSTCLACGKRVADCDGDWSRS